MRDAAPMPSSSLREIIAGSLLTMAVPAGEPKAPRSEEEALA